MRQFVAIAELGSFRRAADALHIAQPALSVSIQKLEQSVGVQLLARGAKGVTLTLAGEALIADARRALFHADQARQAARRVGLGEWGVLRLGFVGSATYALLPSRLPPFRRAFPEIQLDLREDTSARLAAMVSANELDAAVIRGPIAQDDVLEAFAVESDHFVLAVPAAHPLAGQGSIALAQVRSESFVMYSPVQVPGLHSVAQSACRRAGFTPRISQQAIQVQTLVSLVASGMGVALVPSVTRAYSSPLVAFLALTDRDTGDALSLSLVTNRLTANAAVSRLSEIMLAAPEVAALQTGGATSASVAV